MSVRVFAAVLAAALLSAGCAATGQKLLDEARQALAEAPLCCTTLATARRAPLPLQKTEVEVDRTAQAFDFGGNKAFFVLYELPPFDGPYSIVLTSVASGTEEDSALLIPRVATYDADFKVLRYFDEKSLRSRGDNLERTVFVNASDRAERYLAVHGSDPSSSIDRTYSAVTVTPVFAGPVIFNMYGGKDGKSTLRSSPAGRLLVEVRGLAGQASR